MTATESAPSAGDDTHLDQVLEDRRRELQKPWTVLCRDAQVSPQMLRAIRRGERNPSNRTKRRLENALHWEAGSFDVVINGGKPRVVVVTVDLRTNPYDDPVEQALWNLTALPPDERLDYIEFHRAKSAMSGAERRAYIDLLRARRQAAGE